MSTVLSLVTWNEVRYMNNRMLKGSVERGRVLGHVWPAHSCTSSPHLSDRFDWRRIYQT